MHGVSVFVQEQDEVFTPGRRWQRLLDARGLHDAEQENQKEKEKEKEKGKGKGKGKGKREGNTNPNPPGWREAVKWGTLQRWCTLLDYLENFAQGKMPPTLI